MAEVTLIDFSYLNRIALSAFTEVGPHFSNQDSRLGPLTEKVKKTFYLAIFKINWCNLSHSNSKFNSVRPPLFYFTTDILVPQDAVKESSIRLYIGLLVSVQYFVRIFAATVCSPIS